jgi:ABC-type Na+ efflux pump permease subunit
MKKIKAILGKEWANFKGSERGVFFIYGILIFSWSFFPLNKEFSSGPIWWLFFSVIISGNFSNSVFVSERLNGAMEILLTSGFSRDTVFFGKIAFILAMSIIIGVICFSLSILWLSFAGQGAIEMETLRDGILFCAGVLMNVTFGAWMSLRLQSPRIIPFMTILLMGVIVGIFYAMSFFLHAPQWLLGVALTALAVIFGLLARKEFHGERVIQPIHL